MSIAQGSKILASDVANHINDKNNPHGITPASIGAATTAEVNELKTSVSEGKSQIAAAVTGKGVNTAADAAFATMAGNIQAIVTLSEGSADATAAAGQILNGQIAYVKGAKVTGTMANQGAVSKSITPSTSAQSYTIPAGYHNGSGKVSVAAAPAPTVTVYGPYTGVPLTSITGLPKGKTLWKDLFVCVTAWTVQPNTWGGASAAYVDLNIQYNSSAGTVSMSGYYVTNYLWDGGAYTAYVYVID